jgi:hypothetical protein
MSLPLLVVAENGLKSEGIIENGYDWRVYWTDMNPDVVKSDSFKGFLQSWKKAVDEMSIAKSKKESNIDLSKVTIGKLLAMMSVPQLWKLVGVLATVLAIVAGSSYKLGTGNWPWQKTPSKEITVTGDKNKADAQSQNNVELIKKDAKP